MHLLVRVTTRIRSLSPAVILDANDKHWFFIAVEYEKKDDGFKVSGGDIELETAPETNSSRVCRRPYNSGSQMLVYLARQRSKMVSRPAGHRIIRLELQYMHEFQNTVTVTTKGGGHFSRGESRGYVSRTLPWVAVRDSVLRL